jgi:hypothetical protein
MKLYAGTRLHNRFPETRDSIRVTVATDDNKPTPLRSYFPTKVAYDMPLDWGSGQVGFGGTNLSASILADYFDCWKDAGLEPIPVNIINAFLHGVVVKFQNDMWEIDEDEIQEFLSEYADAEIEAVERLLESEEPDYYVSPEQADVLYPMALAGYIPEWDEYRGADSG